MKNWSIPAGKIFGIQVRVHATFLLLLLFVLMTEATQVGLRGAWRALAVVAIVFGSVLVHEIGHGVVALRNNVNVRSIMLLPIGGITIMDEDAYRNPNPRRDMRIAAAGPMVNLVLGVFFGCGVLLLMPQANLFGRPLMWSMDLPRTLVWTNLLLGSFNLIPAYPLDGGRILRAFLEKKTDRIRATRRAVSLGQLFALALIFAGFFNNPWLTLVGVFLFLGGQLEDRSALFQSVLERVRMEDVMLTDFATLSPADTLEDALQKALHSLQDDFPVVRGTDMVGTISKQRIMDALRSAGNGYVQGAMNRMFEVAHRSDTLAAVLRKLGSRGLSLVPVIDGEHLVGIVTLQNLTHSIALLAESRRLQPKSPAQ